MAYKPVKKKQKRGPKTKFNVSYCIKAYRLTLLGATVKEMAEFFEVAESTFCLWLKTYKKLSDSVRKARLEADGNVADRLLQRAMGYTHKEDKIFQYEGVPLIVPTKKYYPPDTQAATFWLKNRRPQDWRDKTDIEHSGEVKTNVIGPIPIVITTVEQQNKLNEEINPDKPDNA
jgi:hypothetical protein